MPRGLSGLDSSAAVAVHSLLAADLLARENGMCAGRLVVDSCNIARSMVARVGSGDEVSRC